jgi:hypothetical protein
MQTSSVTYSPNPLLPILAGDPNIDHPTKPAPDRPPKKKKSKPAPKPAKKKK